MKRLKRLWALLQEVTGQNAYERYCAHLREHHPGQPVPTAKDFYAARQREKYSRPSRCC